MVKADWTIDVIQSLKTLEFIKDIEIVSQPMDVEADMSIMLKVTNWNSSYIKIISKIISDICWKNQEEPGKVPTVHWDYQDAA